MARYEDDNIALDERGMTIKSYWWPGHTKSIGYDDIRAAELIDMKVGTGRWRLVGISPGRLRTFFHWDRTRSSKAAAISLDVGAWMRRAITPDRPEEVLAILQDAIATQ